MTIVLRDELLHLSNDCGCGFVEGYQVMVCPEHQLSPQPYVVRGQLITKPHIRLMSGWMAVVSFPGQGIQRTFAFYDNVPTLLDRIYQECFQ